jgi:plastocyanin
METPTPSQRKSLMYAILGVVAVLLIIGLVFKLSHHQQQLPPAPAPLPKESIVNITNAGFDPSTVTVGVGSAVRWKITGTDKQASVNSDDYPTNRKYPEMNLGLFQSNSTVVHVFTKPGTYTYHNQLKPNEKGTVIVQ